MTNLRKTLLQLALLVGGVLGFALLLDRVIQLTEEIAPNETAMAGIESANLAVQNPPQADDAPATTNVAIAAALTVAPVPTGSAGQPAIRTPDDTRALLARSRESWAMIRPYEGLDYLYFTNVLAHRCGLRSVQYGINSAGAATDLLMEPCHTGTSQPNAMLNMTKYPPVLILPPESIQRVSVALTYLDGTTELLTYDRRQILQH